MPGRLGCSLALASHYRVGQVALSCPHSSTFRPPKRGRRGPNSRRKGRAALFDHLVGSASLLYALASDADRPGVAFGSIASETR
jgi:hypothetical protein